MNKTTLKNYAKLVVKMGANVQKGQIVVINSNVNDEYFTKYIVDECYKAKAKFVYVNWSSDECQKLIYKHSSTSALKELPEWIVERLKYYRDNLPAMIYVDSSDPDALNGINPKKIAEVRKYQGPILKPIRDEMENKYQWTIVSIPGKAWAKKVFPNDSKSKAFDKLWDAIIKCTRVDGDPIDNWNKHNQNLNDKCKKLNDMNIKSLHYQSSNGTDFNISLIKGLEFLGGGAYTTGGVFYNPNMPTEECFISPNKESANGVVYASKPLSLYGNVLTDFGFRFENGKVVEVLAKDDKAKAALTELVNTDEGAKMLGEVALVPYDSPINETGLLFYNTLFDENACCHLALGAGFEETIKDFEKKTKEEIKSYGINDSLIHIDFMIGTEDLSIVATLEDSTNVQIFKDGKWSI